jgi:hypothetical protein
MSGDPMMQQALRALESDPGMIERMLGDPNVANAIANNNAGGDPFARGPDAMRAQMERFEALARQYGGSGGGFNVGGGGDAGGAVPVGTAPTGAAGPRTSSNGGGNNVGDRRGGNDGSMTEEEMIAEAIARSLRET